VCLFRMMNEQKCEKEEFFLRIIPFLSTSEKCLVRSVVCVRTSFHFVCALLFLVLCDACTSGAMPFLRNSLRED
jgi:hypothetical protein